MNYTLIFFCFSCGLFISSIITIFTAPIINGIIGNDWNIQNCQKFKDLYNYYNNEKINIQESQKILYLESLKRGKITCDIKKGMHGLEYSSIIINLILGFICSLLSLLHNFNIGKNFEKKTSFIGSFTGFFGFILIILYISFSGQIFNNESPKMVYLDNDDIPGYYYGTAKLYHDGSFAKWDSSKRRYICNNYELNKILSFYAKYKDMGKKQYNYSKDFIDVNSEKNNCILSPGEEPIDVCEGRVLFFENSRPQYYIDNSLKKCESLYVNYNSHENKYIYNRWICTIFFGCLIALCDVFLLFFGIKISKLNNHYSKNNNTKDIAKADTLNTL